MARRLTVWLLLIAVAIAWADDEADEIPLVGRPVDIPFCGGSGAFKAHVEVTPRHVAVGEPVKLTLTLTAAGPVRHPPRRIDLREIKSFRDRFDIEAARPDDDRRPASGQWEFNYRLRPKRDNVTEVPGVKFSFHNPAIRSADKGSFQTVMLDPLPLTVARADEVPVKIEAPATAFVLAEGNVLRRDQPWAPPGRFIGALAIAIPPLGCVLWYALWFWRNPDAARRARQRRSRAARVALCQLRAARRQSGAARAAAAADAVAGYLHERLDLPIADPTPKEVTECLTRMGCGELARSAAQLLMACDRARYRPASECRGLDPAADAERLILEVEQQACLQLC